MALGMGYGEKTQFKGGGGGQILPVPASNRLKSRNRKPQIDEIDEKFPEIPEKGQIDVTRENLEIETEILGINFLLETNQHVALDKKKALKLVRQALNWAMGNSSLTPCEIAEVFIHESP